TRLDRRSPGLTGAWEHPGLAATATPAEDAELPLVQDRQEAVGVANEELHLLLTEPVVDAATQAMLVDEFVGDRVQSQGHAPAHRKTPQSQQLGGLVYEQAYMKAARFSSEKREGQQTMVTSVVCFSRTGRCPQARGQHVRSR